MKKRARILFEPVSTGLGHITRCLSVANELQRDNFDIAFAVKREQSDFIKSAGYDKVYSLTEEEDKPDFFQKIQAFCNPGYIEDCINEELEIIDDFKPDLIISDGRYTTGISARASKIRWVSIVLALQTSSGVKAAAGDVYRVIDADRERFRAWLEMMLSTEAKPISVDSVKPDIFLAIAEKYADNFRPFLEKFGLPSINSVYELLLSAELNFIPSIPSISAVTELPPMTYYIGPQPASQYVGPLLSGNDYNLLRFGLEIDDEKPVVYATFGGMAGVVRDRAERVYEIILNALGNSNLQVVIASPVLKSQNLSKNIHVTPYLPSNLIFRLKNVILLCHGGLGVLMENLSHGKTSISLPFSMEQLCNAERIKELGAGIWAYPNQIGPDDIRRMVEEMIDDPRYKENSRRLEREIADYQGAAVAVKLLKEYFLRNGY